ncbi:putative late blight resistance protein homolog R1A-10 [Salvia miltiorrhiza]|uniref:putative late blight resistance protein homolog R1A-10 n=1 Tax=Salvia miltiorrhiza TaxID=226208 RepID=UPI0025ACD84B|nr:putative late blight resistance protein homolog R1A-10 [Salvia miltiorrhiza]XP_057787906.1 putative late blight resistance protein homolog R1A-10 [Salvia miltiorrhiza]
MAEAAVSFLLEQVKEVVTEYKDLISGAENEFNQLNKELGLLKAFLKDAAKATKQEHLFREMEKQVREVVYEVEDTIDTCLTKAIEVRAKEAKTKKSPFSLSRQRGSGSTKSVSLLREVKSIREGKVLPMFNEAKMQFSNMRIGDGSGAVDDQRTKLKRDKPIRQNRVVGFEDEEKTIKGYLMPETETARLDVIPIIGIPGQGKTTLAWKIYQDESICYNFPIRIWVYISQKFNSRDVFLQILRKFTTSQNTSNLNDDELAQTVKVCLEKEKFLLVLDDVWSVDAWLGIKEVLPLDNGKGKVLITSREDAVGEATSVYRRAHKLRFLTKPESWMLLQYEVFGSLDECPDELSAIGEHIAIKCDGVPLTIVVIGGILVDQLARGVAMEGWEEVSKNVSDALQKDEAQRITSVVALSYDRLPDDLRDCFVYLGVFPEDYEIPVRVVCGLWIAEGFIQPKDGRNLEETAQDNLNDLIRRNLVKVDKTNPMGKVKTFRVHDMIRAFCITISKKESLFHEIKKFRTGVSQLDEVEKAHRLCFHSDLSNFLSEGPKGPHVRSLLCFYEQPVELNPEHITVIPDGFPKLRILESKSVKFHQFPAKVTKLIHLRYLTLSIDNLTILPEQIYQLWNLQTLIVETKKRSITMKANVWRMVRLRHFKTKAAIVLDNNWEGEAGQNLQTLERLSPESCTEAASRRAKNLKTLGISGKLVNIFRAKFLEKLYHLEKLKLVNSIPYEPTSEDMLHCLPLPNCFPPNLKRLTLSNTFLGWHHMSMLAMINSLEVLKLKDNAFVGVAWKVAGYTFPSLQLLLIVNADLLIWEASPDAFPCLKYLVVKNCENLNKIPESLGKRLQKLEVERLRDSAIESAREIGNSKKGGQKGKFAVDFDLKVGPVSETSKATSN